VIELSFSAEDLLVRLIRANATIRGNPATSTEPPLFRNARCLEVAVSVADVRELLQFGLIEYQCECYRSERKVYRVSLEGKRLAGWQALVDVALTDRAN
jgi:hypothetical protein